MKLIQRRAYGFRNFENYRLRISVLLEKLNLVTIRRFVTKLGNKNNCALYFFIVVINSSYVQIQIKD